MIDDLVRIALTDGLKDETRVLYISPLKALSNDVRRNLEEPPAGIRAELVAQGLPDAEIRTLVRTGDTPASERTAMTKRPPHILVTTPESLFILLTSESGRRILRNVRSVIVDEIHAVRRGELDCLIIPEKPIDILAQQIVAAAAAICITTR